MDKNTSDYSASKSPETKVEAEEQVSQPDPRMLPGGAEPRSDTAQGMAGLDRETVPTMATGSGQTRYPDTARDEVTGK